MLSPLLCLLATVVVAQPPQDIHPWQTECGNYGCFVNWYCAPSTDLCTKCPEVDGGITEDDCRSSFVLAEGASETDSAGDNITVEDGISVTNETTLVDLDSCLNECVKPQEGDACTDDMGCDPGRFFCNYEMTMEDGGGEVEEEDESPTKEGTCTPCKDDIRDCLNDPSIVSPFGVEECILCDIGVCVPLHFFVTTEINIVEGVEDVEDVVIGSTALQGSPMAMAEGEIVSCNNLIYRDEQTCVPGELTNPFRFTCVHMIYVYMIH